MSPEDLQDSLLCLQPLGVSLGDTVSTGWSILRKEPEKLGSWSSSRGGHNHQ